VFVYVCVYAWGCILVAVSVLGLKRCLEPGYRANLQNIVHISVMEMAFFLGSFLHFPLLCQNGGVRFTHSLKHTRVLGPAYSRGWVERG